MAPTRRSFLVTGLGALAAVAVTPFVPAVAAPRPAKLAVLGTNNGDPLPHTSDAKQWRDHFAQFPQLTWARCYFTDEVAPARAAGAAHVLLSMSAKQYWPDGTASKVETITTQAVEYVRSARLVPGDCFTYVHEFERPAKNLARYEKTGHGWTVAFRAIRAAVQAEFPGVLVGPVPTGFGVLQGHVNPFWMADGAQDFYSPDLYSGIDGGVPTTPFKDRAIPVVAIIRRHYPTVRIDFPEINTERTSLSPAWFAAAAHDICAVTKQHTIIFLFQGHGSFAPADFPLYPAAL